MQQLQDQLPSAEESALAKICSRELSAILESGVDTQTLLVTDPSSQQHQVQVPSSALRLLVDVLTELGEGNTVKLIPIHAELTTQEAADMLNVSRPTFIKLLDEDTIPYTRTGNRRKVKFADVKAYKDNLEQQRLTTLEELSELDQDLGLGY
jgi:excisionase family DNA binding protein